MLGLGLGLGLGLSGLDYITGNKTYTNELAYSNYLAKKFNDIGC